MDDFERCLLVKQEVFVYKIPPRQSARGYRAADWNLTVPDWTGRMRLMQQSKTIKLKLEDKGSGELFAACPIDIYPGPAVESVVDSSRYFVIRIVDENGRSAYIGIGFADRSDSFDLNVALQDHFKLVKKEDDFSKESEELQPQLDLAFKEGQTIKVNINIPKGERAARQKPKSGSMMGLLPPPPAGPGDATRVTAGQTVPGSLNLTPLSSPTETAKPVIGSSNVDLLCDTSSLNENSSTSVASSRNLLDDPWGDFTSSSATNASGNWVKF